MPSYPKECDSKRIERIYVYKAKLSAGRKQRIRLYHLVFIALYIYQCIWVLSTVGEPYRQFLEKADREGFQGMSCEVLFAGEKDVIFMPFSHYSLTTQQSWRDKRK